MRKNSFLYLLALFCGFFCVAQQDSLTHEQFQQLLSKYHPIMRQAAIINSMAANDIRAARGAFDPVVALKFGEKQLNGKRYYRQQDMEIRIPTWYGPQVVAGTENLDGQYLNRSQTPGRVNRLGVEIPLGKGLFFDEKRAAVEQAKVYSTMTRWEQFSVVNDLMLEAHEAFFDWWRSYRLMQINAEAISLNEKRLRLIKSSVAFGERPAIDTVEARSQIQSFQLRYQAAQAEYDLAKQKLSVYLWDDAQQNVPLPDFVHPAAGAVPEEDQDATLPENHPILLYYAAKNEYLNWERKLKYQSLLPKVDFSYNFLSKDKVELSAPFQRSFQYGLKVEMPILLRSARALLQNAQLKTELNAVQRDQKIAELRAKIAQYHTLHQNYQQQWRLAQETVLLYQQLLRGENLRFENGEGSIFLINSRESKVFEALEKLVETEAKMRLALYKLRWAKGELWVEQPIP